MAFGDLPANVMVSILLALDYKSILRMKAVSKSWNMMVSPNPCLWKWKFELDFGELTCDLQAKIDFEQEYKIEFSWREGSIKTTHLNECQERLNDIKVDDYIMVSCSMDKSIRIWDLEKQKQVREIKLEQHVLAVAFDNERVFIGLRNGTIGASKVSLSGHCRFWGAHDDAVLHLAISNMFLVSIDILGYAKVWDMVTYECRYTFDVGYGHLNLVHVDAKEIVVGISKAHQVNVYGHQEDGLLYSLETMAKVYSVCANARYVFVSCFDGNIQVWDRNTTKRVVTLIGSGAAHKMHVWCDSRKLISATHCGYVKIWDVQHWTCIRNVSLPKNVTCMEYNDRTFVVGTLSGGIHFLTFGR